MEFYIKKKVYRKDGSLKKIVQSDDKVVTFYKDGSVMNVYYRLLRTSNPFILSFPKGQKRYLEV